MDKRLEKIEREINNLKRREQEVYIVFKKMADDTYKIIGCYSGSHMAYRAAYATLNFVLSFSENDLVNMKLDSGILDYYNDVSIKVEKVLLVETSIL